jgi:hypothetical protein
VRSTWRTERPTPTAPLRCGCVRAHTVRPTSTHRRAGDSALELPCDVLEADQDATEHEARVYARLAAGDT